MTQVGGIHTVIRTKAEQSVEELGSSYFLLGPYNPRDAVTEVEQADPFLPEIESVLNAIRGQGVKVSTGTWSVPGSPNVILFDILSAYGNIEGWRHELHQHTGIPFNVSDKELNDTIIFGGVVAWFLGELRKRLNHTYLMLGHFHEWNSAIGLIFLKKRGVDIGLIFTTHATLVGRHLSAGQCDLYNNLKDYDCDYEAGKRGFYANHCLERCAAHQAHVFTTVSNGTAQEAEAFFHRYPDIITPNGLRVKSSYALHEFQNLHVVCKELIHEFVRGHFFGSYYFDLDKTIYFFNAGRYEFANKGVDILLEAAYRLNNILKAQNTDVTVVLFLIFNSRTNNYNIESLKNQAIIRQLRQTVEKTQAIIGQRIFDSVMFGKMPDAKNLLQSKEITELKKYLHTSRSIVNLPPIVTHNMLDDAGDPILCSLRRLQLFNSVDDKVKVSRLFRQIVFHPQFLSSTSALFPIDYESFVRGCHMGIFPSYYEPWGYTPAECTILGIPSLTTNLSGFGQFMEDHIKHPMDYGIYIIDRKYSCLEESINQLTHYMYVFVSQSQKERIMQRNRCERLSEILDWKRLNIHYSRARALAVERTHPDKLRAFKTIEDLTIRFRKIERLLFSPSPRQSEHNSEDENLDLYGKRSCNGHL